MRRPCADAVCCSITDAGVTAASTFSRVPGSEVRRASPPWCWRWPVGLDSTSRGWSGWQSICWRHRCPMAAGTAAPLRGMAARRTGPFHTTILRLEALARMAGGRAGASAGEEFLLAHRLFRSHRTGAIAKADFTPLPLSAALALRRAARVGLLRASKRSATRSATRGSRRDRAGPRAEARPMDGWHLARAIRAGLFRNGRAGQASRWNTMRALRVLGWAGLS